MRAALLLLAIVASAACGKREPAAAATPLPAASPTPVSQWDAKGELLARPAIETAARDVAVRLGYHGPAIEAASFDAATGSWQVTVVCGNRDHARTSLLLTLDARTALVRRHRVATGTARDACVP